MDVVFFVVMGITLAIGAALLVAPFLAPTAASMGIRFLVLGAWACICYVAALGLFMFNYCEHNCSSANNGPTFLILLVLLFFSGASYWVSYKVVGRSRENASSGHNSLNIHVPDRQKSGNENET